MAPSPRQPQLPSAVTARGEDSRPKKPRIFPALCCWQVGFVQPAEIRLEEPNPGSLEGFEQSQSKDRTARKEGEGITTTSPLSLCTPSPIPVPGTAPTTTPGLFGWKQPRARHPQGTPGCHQCHHGVPAPFPPARLTLGTKSVCDGQERNPRSRARHGLLSALPSRLLWRGAGGKRGREQLPLWRSPGETLAQPRQGTGGTTCWDMPAPPGTAVRHGSRPC